MVTFASVVLLAFSASVGASYAVAATGRIPTPSGPRYVVQGAGAFWCVVVFTAIALVGFALRPSEFTTRRSDISLLIYNPTPFTVLKDSVIRYSGFLGLLSCICAISTKQRSVFVFLLPISGAAAILVNNPLNIARFPLFAMIICALVVLTNTATAAFKRIFVGCYLAGIVTIFPLLSQLSRGDRGSDLFVGLTKYYSSSGDFDGFQSLINTTYWIDNASYQWGHQIISALLVFIPRAIWADKATGTGGLAAAYAGYGFTNISAPLPAELYADFGLIGVIIGGVVLGLLIARLNRSMAKSHGNLASLASLGMAAGFIAILLRGSLIGVVGPSGLAILMGRLLWVADDAKVPWHFGTEDISLETATPQLQKIAVD